MGASSPDKGIAGCTSQPRGAKGARLDLFRFFRRLPLACSIRHAREGGNDRYGSK